MPAHTSLRYVTLLLLTSPLVVGCTHLTPTDRGVLGGAAVGGVTGAIIGKATGNTGVGAAVGTAIGGVTGGLTGNAVERAEDRGFRRGVEEASQVQPPAAPPLAQMPLDLSGVVRLATTGVSDQIIINQIHSTHSRYNLSYEDIVYLKQNGVSDRVIGVMQQTASRPVSGHHCPPPNRTVIIERRPPPVYVVPRPRYSIGFTYHSRPKRCRH